MKYLVIYCEVEQDAGIFATRKPYKSEFIETEDSSKLKSYIESQSDSYGGKFKKCNPIKNYGYSYISNQGGVKVEIYNKPKFKKL